MYTTPTKFILITYTIARAIIQCHQKYAEFNIRPMLKNVILLVSSKPGLQAIELEISFNRGPRHLVQYQRSKTGSSRGFLRERKGVQISLSAYRFGLNMLCQIRMFPSSLTSSNWKCIIIVCGEKHFRL